jgi:hypothetical protein
MCGSHYRLLQRIIGSIQPGLTLEDLLANLSGGGTQPLMDAIAGKPGATLEDVTAALALGGGGDMAAVAQLINDAVAAVGEPVAQSVLDAFGGTVADLTAYIAGVDDNLATTTTMAFSAQSGLEQFLRGFAGNPDPSLITVANGGLAGLAVKAWEALVAQVAGSLSEAEYQRLLDVLVANAGGTVEEFEGIWQALIAQGTAGGGSGGADLQPLLDLLAVRPNATLADVEAVWQGLSDQATQHVSLLSLLAGRPADSTVTVADVQAGLPVIIQTVVDTALGRPLNGPLLVSTGLTAGVPGDSAWIVAHHPGNRPANLDLQAPGGQVRANGQPVQTEGDVIAKVVDMLKVSPQIGSPTIEAPRIKGTIYDGGGARIAVLEHVNETTLLRISNGQTGPELGAKPSSGSTLDGNIRLRPYGRGAVEIGTALASATVRVVSDLANADLVLEPQGTGNVTVAGKRVLTVDDALNAASGGIDQAAVEAAVAAATAPLLARIDALEAAAAANNATITAMQQTVDAIAAQQVTEHDWLLTTIQSVEADYNGKFDSTDQTLGQLLQNQDTLLQNDADIVEWVLTECATKADLALFGQDVEQAVGNIGGEVARFDGLFLKFGAGSTAAECLDDFFVTLNSIVGQLIDATGITPARTIGERQ